MDKKVKLLIIDDDEDVRTITGELLCHKAKQWQVEFADCGEKAKALAQEIDFDAALVDIKLPDMDGADLIYYLKSICPDIICMVMTGYASVANTVRAVHSGAYDYFQKPLDIDVVLKRLGEALEKRSLRQDLKESHRKLIEEHEKLKRAQITIIQQEKMASIGQLAAGVAHEINNPICFVISNIVSLRKYIDKLHAFIEEQELLLAGADLHGELKEQVQKIRKEHKIDLIIDDLGNLIAESLEGADRVKNIVLNLKSFSRIDEEKTREYADLNEGIESTLGILANELKYKTTVKEEFGEIPPVRCHLRQINQVVMNLLVNAVQAIDKQGEISIKTWVEGEMVYASFSDTGCGIPPENIPRLFEPFFTTKKAGTGTGLGLTISYDIIKKHKGDIRVESEVGKGTTFTVEIPVQ